MEYLLLSCILATKPVKGICGVSCTMGGGGGGATDTEAATPHQKDQRSRQTGRCGKRDVTEQEENRVDHGRVKAKTLQGEFAEKQRDILIFFQCRFVSHFPRTTCRDILDLRSSSVPA